MPIAVVLTCSLIIFESFTVLQLHCHLIKNNGIVKVKKIYFHKINNARYSTEKTTKQNKQRKSQLVLGNWNLNWKYIRVINQNLAYLYIHFLIRLRAGLFGFQSQKASKHELSCERFFIPVQKNSYSHKNIADKCYNQGRVQNSVVTH